MESNYCSMSLAQLRTQLRRRNAKLSGRKKELIERLEAYDRNQNFGQDSNLLPEYTMDVPKTSDYKDLHGEMKIAHLTFDLAYEYLEKFNVEFDNECVDLYKEKFLLYLRLCPSDTHDFIESACHASMKKKVTYVIDISLKKNGQVDETQCECGSGEGPNGHCKHIRAVHFACCKFVKSGVANVELTCTEKITVFPQS